MPRPPSLRTMASSSSLTSSLTNTVLRFLIFGTVRYVSRYSSSEALRCLPLVLLLTGSSGSGGVSFLPASYQTYKIILPCRWFARFHASGYVPFFPFGDFFFSQISLLKFSCLICLHFRLPPFSRLSVSRIRQSFPFWAQR